jgi:hypothetical protein
MKLDLDADLLSGVAMSTLVEKVMLGPAHESNLGLAAVRRMLVKSGHEALSARLVQSTTPFRPV